MCTLGVLLAIFFALLLCSRTFRVGLGLLPVVVAVAVLLGN